MTDKNLSQSEKLIALFCTLTAVSALVTTRISNTVFKFILVFLCAGFFSISIYLLLASRKVENENGN